MNLNLIEFVRIAATEGDNPFYHHYLKGRTCLDVACGEGRLLKRSPQTFVGVDLDEQLVNECRKQGLQVHWGSCTNLSMFKTESFDTVHCSNIIEHLEPQDAAQMLEECARVLKPNGVILIDTPSQRNVWNTFSHIRPYPPIAFEKLLSRKTEGYIQKETRNSALHRLKLERVFHKGSSGSRVTYLLYLVIFNFMFSRNIRSIPPRCDGHLIVLRKL